MYRSVDIDTSWVASTNIFVPSSANRHSVCGDKEERVSGAMERAPINRPVDRDASDEIIK